MTSKDSCDLQLIHLFVHLVRAGGFTQVSQSQGIPVATVSRKITKLEASMNTQLIMRSTRKLRLTEEGAVLFGKYHPLIEQFDQLNSDEVTIPQGTLRIATPVSISSMILMKSFNAFSKRYPQIKLHISQNNQTIDLIDEGVDVAIVGGAQPDSSWVSQSLGVLKYGLFASTNYINNAPELVHPKQLHDHQLIKVWPLFNWTLKQGAEEYYYEGDAKITLGDIHGAVNACVDDGGIMYGPQLFVQPQLERGDLVPVLPEWQGENRRICILYHQRKQHPIKVQLFIDFMLNEAKDIFTQ
ncbi:LysR family transcriptional regulator [Shewanella gaetbuli]|uniref:LysR family transcriptional regulator n=1 Tax=Shewanella gaetbuli TaxID=220752 RepID=A0A9X1ZJ44_9GAMM|nr:LysR family transcriptional regulator [Shewanella gaetbuli]MCL1142436.1 LysR family transcriptional regulator [Shewanella gaetbuli]